MSLEGRTVLVTGAASGIGLATAARLLDLGARVHAVSRRRERMEERLADWSSSGRLALHRVDVTDEDAVARLLAEVGEDAPLDALVCAAGTNIPDRRLRQLTQEGWRSLIETNLGGVFSCVTAALPQLQRTRGHVVAVASVSSQWPDASGPAYQASKAGVLGFLRACALEEHERGIRFTTILPGMVVTELLDKRPVPTPDDVRALCLQPEDVAATIVFALGLPPRACIAELTVLPTALQALGAT